MLESLAWEQWPCFSNNRYLEEAKKSSKLGLVAQRKAYFEALYKRNAAKKAGALLEEQNAASNDLSEPNVMEETAQILQEFQLGHQWMGYQCILQQLLKKKEKTNAKEADKVHLQAKKIRRKLTTASKKLSEYCFQG